MNFNSQNIIRIIRGIIGAIMVIAGIMYNSWIGFIGVFFLIGALRGGCGIGSSSCQIQSDRQKSLSNFDMDIPDERKNI